MKLKLIIVALSINFFACLSERAREEVKTKGAETRLDFVDGESIEDKLKEKHEKLEKKILKHLSGKWKAVKMNAYQYPVSSKEKVKKVKSFKIAGLSDIRVFFWKTPKEDNHTIHFGQPMDFQAKYDFSVSKVTKISDTPLVSGRLGLISDNSFRVLKENYFDNHNVFNHYSNNILKHYVLNESNEAHDNVVKELASKFGLWNSELISNEVTLGHWIYPSERFRIYVSRVSKNKVVLAVFSKLSEARKTYLFGKFNGVPLDHDGFSFFLHLERTE